MRMPATGGDSLTRTEAEVLGLVDRGFSNREIAATRSIAVGTVKCHLHRVYEKLRVRNRIEAANAARERGHLSSVVRSPALTQERIFG